MIELCLDQGPSRLRRQCHSMHENTASPVLDPDVLHALRGVNDPEIGINIVDLGLVYRAERKPEAIEVALTPSTPSCPLTEMLVEEAREALRRQFAQTPVIRVELVWDPPWTPERMSETARRQLR
ncbi:MAG TPA: metal-sulfur cluster assembly factor [Xanthobacteraceae bacterium]